jgi:hypothetical protein
MATRCTEDSVERLKRSPVKSYFSFLEYKITVWCSLKPSECISTHELEQLIHAQPKIKF